MKFKDPASIEGWLSPHSQEWYNQLAAQSGSYDYGWNSKIKEPNGETVFDEKVLEWVNGKTVLDVGCGHGDFTVRCSLNASRITGIDRNNVFLQTGAAMNAKNVTFVLGDSKQGLPFGQGEFECAYNRKGPTSAYLHLGKVVSRGGRIFGLHPGDGSQKELPFLFPGLFKKATGLSIKERISSQLKAADFSSYQIETIDAEEFLSTPMDVLNLLCFGQANSVLEQMEKEAFNEVTKIFGRYAEREGLRVTHSRYIVEAIV